MQIYPQRRVQALSKMVSRMWDKSPHGSSLNIPNDRIEGGCEMSTWLKKFAEWQESPAGKPEESIMRSCEGKACIVLETQRCWKY